MDEIKQKALDISIKHGKACLIELASECAFPFVKSVVDKSPTKVDDMVLAALEEPAKKAMVDFLAGLGIKK